MKKNGILNSRISGVVSELGHTDQIIICDSGLPIPYGVERIDLALKRGVPSFIETLETVLTEMQVEKAYIARELAVKSPEMHAKLKITLHQAEIITISHEQLKERSNNVKAIIRTGECTPYANVVLQAGVIF
ncbi:D-ribose pyranase [Paenactinomyces guangxiensis]|uniref:D-ribose pyranase n=1 Tax=Paenactinomyces guangxiensis TaxID=1490290 RepID=A0A7W2A9R7_9BACL|nr:D-ribose pyranase [Paenactinomyces guangxiensis]MBA4495497.1 D-ribose pyranase [Paenactinomyces guangxiensis]MBH8592380.1 D-ribose pyranase [Paenactinomyces guangxiensis]